jgi:hypothetical protein
MQGKAGNKFKKKKNTVSVHSFRVPDLQTLSFPQIGTAS